MKIHTADFITSVAALHQIPPSKLPEIAFIGRSNVGKSSLINSICNRKSLAKTSSQPGKTRVINFYRINKNLHLVDLPGYGYAKAPNQVRSGWQQLIEGYLKNCKNLKLGFVITDARHELTKLDLAMLNWLEYYRIPYALILTKSDKVPKYKVQQRVSEIQKNIQQKNEYCKAVLPYSSLSGDGKPQLLMLINRAVATDSKPNSPNSAEMNL